MKAGNFYSASFFAGIIPAMCGVLTAHLIVPFGLDWIVLVPVVSLFLAFVIGTLPDFSNTEEARKCSWRFAPQFSKTGADLVALLIVVGFLGICVAVDLLWWGEHRGRMVQLYVISGGMTFLTLVSYIRVIFLDVPISGRK